MTAKQSARLKSHGDSRAVLLFVFLYALPYKVRGNQQYVTADNFNAQIVESNGMSFFRLFEFMRIECYNFVG